MRYDKKKGGTFVSSVPKSNCQTVSIRMTPEKYNYIKEQAKSMSLSINSYCTKRLFDETGGCRAQFDCIMRLIPRIYTLVDRIEDITVRTELEKEVSQICQYLR